MTRFLVTGGYGLIGREAIGVLHAAGHAVKVLDVVGREDASAVFGDTPYIQGSAADPDVLIEALKGVDCCIHMAGSAVLADPRRESIADDALFVAEARTLFSAAANAGARVIYASSAAVYGAASGIPTSEETEPDPITAHGLEKRAFEKVAAEFAETEGLPTIGLRMFNVYGAAQSLASPYCGVVRRFVEALLTGEPAEVRGDGAQRRDFVHARDAAACVQIVSGVPFEGARVLNVCSGHGVSINEMIAVLEAVAGRAMEVVYGPTLGSEVTCSVGDPRMAEREFGFRPAVELKDGLREMIAEVRAKHAAAA